MKEGTSCHHRGGQETISSLRRERICMNKEDYEKKLFNYYDTDGKLIQYPSKKPMRVLALLKIAAQFQKEQKYTEKQVNEIIRSEIAFSDIELIRREMYQYKILGRLKDGSQYWLEADWEKGYESF